MDKKELKQKKILRQQEVVNTAKAMKRGLSTEEQAEFDTLQREIEQLQKEIEEEEKGESSVEAERQRAAEIIELCRNFNIEAEEYIRKGTNVDTVRKAILDKLKEEKTPVSAKGIDTEVTKSGEDKFREAAADALLMRGGIEIEKSSEGARELMGMRLRDIAFETMKSEEPNFYRKSDDEVFTLLQRQFYNPTAAFPAILDIAINKAYTDGHKRAAVTFDRWTKKGSLNDFKTHDNYYITGSAGEFLEVPEGGELKHDIPSDAKKPTRKLRTYGRQFTMTRQAFVNDDISFLSTLPARYARSARTTINKRCCEIMLNNPAIYDGDRLFSSNHKNLLASGTGITQEAVQTMIQALQTQKNEFGEAIIIRPAIILVPSGYEFQAYSLFQSQTIQTTDNTQAVNPLYVYRNQIEVITEPTFNALCKDSNMPWWLLACKEDTDFIEVDYLNGKEVPVIQRNTVPGTLGFVWDIYLDWGINVMDYRGAIQNLGIEITSPLALA